MACAKWGHQLAAMTLPTWLALYFGKDGNDVLLCCALHDRILSTSSNWHWRHETKNELLNRETM